MGFTRKNTISSVFISLLLVLSVISVGVSFIGTQPLDDFDSGTAYAGSYNIDLLVRNASLGANDVDAHSSTLAWNDDGTKLFVGYGLLDDINVIYEYELTTPYDITTANQVRSTDVGSNIRNLRGIQWGSNGDKLYVADTGGSTSKLHEYTASSPYNISTISHTFKLNVKNEVPNVDDVTVKPDGSEIYLVDFFEKEIITYTMSSYDLSTASPSATWSIPQGDYAQSMAWNDDGTKLYTSGEDKIHEYNVSTQYDTTSAVKVDKKNLGKYAYDMVWKPDGSELYIIDDLDDAIYQYEMEAWLNGTVTNPNGDPLDNVTIEVVNSSTGAVEANSTVNSQGQYDFQLSTGVYEITASRDGYMTETRTETLQDHTTTNFTLLQMVPGIFYNRDNPYRNQLIGTENGSQTLVTE